MVEARSVSSQVQTCVAVWVKRLQWSVANILKGQNWGCVRVVVTEQSKVQVTLRFDRYVL